MNLCASLRRTVMAHADDSHAPDTAHEPRPPHEPGAAYQPGGAAHQPGTPHGHDPAPRPRTPDPHSVESVRIPYVHGRHLVPVRRQPTRFTNPVRQRLFAEEDEIRARIDEVDRLLVDLSTERKRLLDRIRQVHDRLRPSYDGARGRRRRAISHEEPLPPTADKPQWLSGRALRSVCLAFLGLADGPLTLRQLHVLLHRAGYAIRHHAVKALADALGHEATAGRARRVARGVYARASVAPGDDVSTLPDW